MRCLIRAMRSDCSIEFEPQAEVCDGQDNDCDDVIDEGWWNGARSDGKYSRGGSGAY